MTLWSPSRISAFLLVLLAFPTVSHGQASPQDFLDCEVFDSCALRVRHGLIRTEIVRGAEDTPVARIGFGTPPLHELFARSDRAAVSFDQFSVDHKRTSWLRVLGGIEIVGGLVARAQENDDWAMALSISGIAIEVAAAIFSTRADEHLSRAIWWHNESLSDGSAR